jgi:hypothetical protein
MLLNSLLLLALLLSITAAVFAMFHIIMSVWFVQSTFATTEFLLGIANVKPSDTVYDLGAGDASVLIAVKRHVPQCTVVGYELLPAVYLQGCARIWLSQLQVNLHWQSFHTVDLAPATIIFCYLIPKEMRRLEQKFAKELRPGTKVFSSMFALPTRKPVAIHTYNDAAIQRRLYEYIF